MISRKERGAKGEQREKKKKRRRRSAELVIRKLPESLRGWVRTRIKDRPVISWDQSERERTSRMDVQPTI